MKCKCVNVHSLNDLCDSCRGDYEKWLRESDLELVRPQTKEEIDVFRGSRVASPEGEAVRAYFNQFKKQGSN
jgi:hypothetical protein